MLLDQFHVDFVQPLFVRAQLAVHAAAEQWKRLTFGFVGHIAAPLGVEPKEHVVRIHQAAPVVRVPNPLRQSPVRGGVCYQPSSPAVVCAAGFGFALDGSTSSLRIVRAGNHFS